MVRTVKIGTYRIPDKRLFPSLVETTKLIYGKFSSEEISNMDMLAKFLGHKSANSGTFLAKLTYLRAYGLIEGRGTVKVSEIGKKLTYPTNEQEKMEAMEQAILHIPLWKEFYSRWGVNLPNSDFWVDLAKITGLEPPEAQRLAEEVRKAYLDDVKYLKPKETPKEGFAMEQSKLEVGRPSITIPEDFTKIETEDFIVGVRRNLESIESFESFDFKAWLKTIKRKLGQKKEETTKTEHE